MKSLLLSGTACLILTIIAASVGVVCVWSYENVATPNKYRRASAPPHPLTHNVVSAIAMICSVVCIVSYLGACFFFLRLAWVML